MFSLRFYAISNMYKKIGVQKILKKFPGGGSILFLHCNSKKPIDVHFFLISFRVICYFQHYSKHLFFGKY